MDGAVDNYVVVIAQDLAGHLLVGHLARAIPANNINTLGLNHGSRCSTTLAVRASRLQPICGCETCDSPLFNHGLVGQHLEVLADIDM